MALAGVVGAAAPARAQVACDVAAFDDGTGLPAGGIPPLVIAEIVLGAAIVLANNTEEAIALAEVPHQLCSPFSYVSVAALGEAIVVPARGRAALPWPITFEDTDKGGEVILYVAGSFSTGSSIADFVCWGVNPHSSRKSLAESVGKWSGACAPALEAGSLQRIAETTGTTAASYETGTAPIGEACPEPGAASAGFAALAALSLRARSARRRRTARASRQGSVLATY